MPMLRWLFLLYFILFGFAVTVWADLDENRNQLQQIRQRIEDAQVDLQHKQKSEVQVSRELALLKRTLQRIDRHISALKKEQRQVITDIEQQQLQVEAGKKTLRAVDHRLEKRLVALYKEGEVGPLKILFTADSPSELVQQYHYLTRVIAHDRELLTEYRQVIGAQQRRLSELEELKQQKVALLEKEKQQRQVAADGRRLQARLLKKVKNEKKQLRRELTVLQEKEARLQGLIKRLQQERTAQPQLPPAAGAVRFTEGRGKLGWPVNGQVLIGFGTKKDKTLGTYYESNGIEIAAAPGTSIQAVADGKVVYADWFNGYGNLIILSHAGGYHSLYAQAAELHKSAGETVRAGEVLGKSGLGGRDSIYFEIRHQGTPVNPLHWLQRR